MLSDEQRGGFMATEALHFNSNQGALTVVYDLIGKESKEPSSIVTYMEKVFPSQEYIYKQVDEVPDCDTMIEEILNRKENMDIILPANNRMVFCYYIDLEDLTKEWIDLYYRRADELRLKQPVSNLTDQHHIVCFRFKVAVMGKEEIQNKAALLVDLATRDLTVSKELFMLRTTALERFENQENGLVETLYLQSRVNNTDYINAMYVGNNALRMVVYEDYYENRNAKCIEGINEIDEWLKTPIDPDFTRLKDNIKEVVIKALSDLRSITRNFGRIATLYPVNKEDFEPVKTLFFVTGYTSKIGRNHPILVEQRKKMIDGKREAIKGGIDVAKIMGVIEDYHYPDLKKLSVKNTDFAQSIISDVLVDQKQKLPEEVDFASEIIDSIMEKVRSTSLITKIDDPEEGIRSKKERSRKRLQKEKLSAGIYKDLDECLAKIDGHAKPNLINGIFGAPSYKIALVNDDCYARIQSDYNGIYGFSSAYNYAGIDPCEIVVTKVYNMADLSGTSAVDNLLRILV